REDHGREDQLVDATPQGRGRADELGPGLLDRHRHGAGILVVEEVRRQLEVERVPAAALAGVQEIHAEEARFDAAELARSGVDDDLQRAVGAVAAVAPAGEARAVVLVEEPLVRRFQGFSRSHARTCEEEVYSARDRRARPAKTRTTALQHAI